VVEMQSTPLTSDEAVPEGLPELPQAVTRTVDLEFSQQHWRIVIDLVTDVVLADWLSVSDRIEELEESGRTVRQLRIRMPLTHPFVTRFAGPNLESLEPILRLAIGVALSEVVARDAGVKMAGAIRLNLNELLRDALATP
jgi:hypothetical protein